MKDYGITYSSERPEEVDVKSTKVFVASNIEEVKGEDGIQYSYDLTEYDKDEYEAVQSGKKSMLRSGNDPQYFTTLNGYYCKDAAGRALLAELESIVHPDLVTLNATQNGVYVPTTSYGYDTVNVNVPFYARADATLADVSTVEGDEMHIEPTAGTSYYPRLFLMATPSPNPEVVDPVDVGKLFEPDSGSWAVQPYIDIIDKATGQSVTGYPQQVHTGASFAINSGGYCRIKSWTYANDKISVTTTRYNTTYQAPIDNTYATQNDVDDWCSAYATGPYVVYSTVDTQYAVGDVIDISQGSYTLTSKDLTAVGIRIYGDSTGVGTMYNDYRAAISVSPSPDVSPQFNAATFLTGDVLHEGEYVDVFAYAADAYTTPLTGVIADAMGACTTSTVFTGGSSAMYIHKFSFIYEVT